MTQEFQNFVSPHSHPKSLDSASLPVQFVKREVELGNPAVVCTDHGTLGASKTIFDLATGALEYEKKKKANLIPILGLEAYFRDDDCPILKKKGVPRTPEIVCGKCGDRWKDPVTPGCDCGSACGIHRETYRETWSKYQHVTIHFRSYSAYLCGVRLLTKADLHAERHGSERKPIFSWADMEELAAHDVDAMSSCLIGLTSRHVIDHNDFEVAAAYYERFRSLFGKGRWYTEIFPHRTVDYWVKAVVIKLEDGRTLKYHFGKKLKTNVGEIVASDLAASWSRGKSQHQELRGVKNYRVWDDWAQAVRLVSVEQLEGFLPNECRDPWAMDGDLQRGCNQFQLYLAEQYGDPCLVSDDSHYAYPKHKVVQDIRLLQQGNWRMSDGYHRLSSAEAYATLRETLGVDAATFVRWVQNSRDWAENFRGFKFPSTPMLPTKFYPGDPLERTMQLIEKHGRMPWGDPVYEQRLAYELELFAGNGKTNLLPYFFPIEEICGIYAQRGELTGVGRGCLTGDAMVLTNGDGYKRLDEVIPGDVLFSHQGQSQKVLRTFRYPLASVDKLLTIRTEYAFGDITMTSDHLVWARVANERPEYVKNPKSWAGRWAEPDAPAWVRADKLKLGDWLFQPLLHSPLKAAPKAVDLAPFVAPRAPSRSVIRDDGIVTHSAYNEENPIAIRTIGSAIGLQGRHFLKKVRDGHMPVNARGERRLKQLREYLAEQGMDLDEWRAAKQIEIKTARHVPIDKEFAYLLGKWIGDGWCNGQRLAYAFHKVDEDEIRRTERFWNGLGFRTSRNTHAVKQLVQLYILDCSRALEGWFRAWFPEYQNTSGTKYIPRFIIDEWPLELLGALIRGLQSADGHISVPGNNGRSRENIDTTSRRLALEVREVLHRLGVPSRIGVRQPFMRGKNLCNTSYKVVFSGLSVAAHRDYSAGIWCKVLSIAEAPHQEFVYDLEMEGEHSYLTQNFAVHNSAAGTLLAYLLEITHADPIRYKLSIDRFLTLDRVQAGKLPDIDQDLPERDWLIEPGGWLEQRFGDHVAQIGTDMKLSLKSSVKDVHRALHGRVPPEIEELTKQFSKVPQGVSDIDHVLGYKAGDAWVPGAIETDPALKQYAERWPTEWEVVQSCLAMTRGQGRHPCGFIICDRPVGELMPLTSVKGHKVTQYSAEPVESVGGVKYDFLGLDALLWLSSAIRLIHDRWGGEVPQQRIIGQRVVPKHRLVPKGQNWIDVWDLPEDLDVFGDIARGDSVTVFQFGSDGARQWMNYFNHQRPSGRPLIASIYDLAVFTALDRPGPLDAYVEDPDSGKKHNMLVEYARRARGLPSSRDIPEVISKLMPETYGVMVFQEQLQYSYQQITGCSGAEAEEFRRDIAKKKMEKVLKKYDFFVERAAAQLGGVENAKKVWEMYGTFGQYGFNLSHSICYSIIGYACAYLKRHFPLEWWSAVLSCNDKTGHKDRIQDTFWPHVAHLVDMPDVSKSGDGFELQNDRIRAPLSLVDGVGPQAHEELVSGRPYRDIVDFCEKIQARRLAHAKTKPAGTTKAGKPTPEKRVLGHSSLHRGIVYKLVLAGVLDSLFPADASLYQKLEMYERALAEAQSRVTGKKVKLGAVDTSFLALDSIARYQAIKRILPVYSAPLAPLVSSDQLPLYSGRLHYHAQDELLPTVTAQELTELERPGILPEDGLRVAALAYVSTVRPFVYKDKQRWEFVLDLDGGRRSFVYWGPRRGQKRDGWEVREGAIVAFVLERWNESRGFAIREWIVLREPLPEDETADIPRIWNKKHEVPAGAVLIDRSTKWGNKWSHLKDSGAEFKTATVREACEEYERWLPSQPQLVRSLHELDGKHLVCHCAPKAGLLPDDGDGYKCHGQVLMRLVKNRAKLIAALA